jgi:hypothetical protein
MGTDPIGSHEVEMDLIALLARGYGVAADLYSVAEAVSERVEDHPTQAERAATIPVLSGLLQTPGSVARLRQGDDPFGPDRKAAMVALKIMIWAWKPRPTVEGFIDGVLEEVRSTLLRVSGFIEDA